MKRFINLLLLLVLASLSGCAFLNALKQDSPTDKFANYPSLQTFNFEGAVIYYKDLSDPCDDTTVAWNDLNEVSLIQQASLDVPEGDCSNVNKVSQSVAEIQFEVRRQISIEFESSKSNISDNQNAKSFSALNELASANSQFHIYGAAGATGKRSEALGLARATIVKDHLISLGVHYERIAIMPYDPTIPGLQALIKVLEPVIL